MKTEFDPFETQFDPSLDPITADQQALAILDKLDEGKNMSGEIDPALIQEGNTKLLKNLAGYEKYKQRRGETLFSHEAEARSRKKGFNEERIARDTVKVFQADTESFHSMLREEGQFEEFQAWEQLMPDGHEGLRKPHLLDRTMRAFGFSQREIASGFAEPQFREMIEAGDHEPTEDAVLRWGLDRVNKYDRRRKIADAATELATVRFLGMSEDKDTFEQQLEKENPGLTDEERVYIRSLRANTLNGLNRDFKSIRPLVRKAFNTIAAQEGVSSDFDGEEDVAFGSLHEAVTAMVDDVPREDFPKVIAMLAKTAEAHGQDIDGFMNKARTSLKRGVEGAGENFMLKTIGRVTDEAEKARERRKNPAFRKIQDGFAALIGANDEMEALDRSSDEEFQEEIDKANNYRAFYGELANWRDAVAKVTKTREGGLIQNLIDDPIGMMKEDFVFGVLRSIPEMTAAMAGPLGLSVIYQAQGERNMQQLRRTHQGVPDSELQKVAESASFGYTALSAFQGKILFGKMPFVNKFQSKVAQGATSFVTRVTFEALQESAQDAMLPLTQELYSAIDEDIADVNLSQELGAIIERFPRTMFASAPFAIIGSLGRQAKEFMDPTVLNQLIRDKVLLRRAGFDEQTIDDLQGAPLDEAIDIVQGAPLYEAIDIVQEADTMSNDRTTGDTDGFAPEVVVNPDGTFTVSSDQRATKARSPEEAAAVAAEMAAEAQANKPVPPTRKAPTSTKDNTIGPNDTGMTVFHSFVAPGFKPSFDAGEPKQRVKDGLPPIPDKVTGDVTDRARRRFGLQSWLGQRNVPSKTLQKTLDEGTRKAEGVESQFNDVAKSIEDRMKRNVKEQPLASRDAMFKQLQADGFLALRGDNQAFARLPKNMQEVITDGRRSIDAYSQKLIDDNVIDDDLATKVGSNIGAYVTRQFKVFDPDAKWNYQTVKRQHPKIYNNALNYIRDKKGMTVAEADLVIQTMLDSSRAGSFIAGTGKINKIDVTSFIKRKDLEDPILDLLGEERNPAVIVRNTGKKLSRIVITHATQSHMAEQLLTAGLGSRKADPSKRHTVRLGEETYQYGALDDHGNPVTKTGVQTKKSFSGFGDIYLEPELATPLELHFDPGLQKGESGFATGFNMLAKITGVGKFNQVILNPAAYPTNFLGGVATEIFNGRISLDGKGRNAYFKFGSFRDFGSNPNKPYSVPDQMQFYSMTGKSFLASGGVKSMTRNQINSEMQQRGIRDNSVFAEDINQTIERGYGEKVAEVSRVLSKGYQAPDNAIKRSAFAHELNKWAHAEPDLNMDELVQLAAEDVRMTTQNYDMVPGLLKAFSQRGVIIPTYISFSYELYRNTINTVRLAAREIQSGNPVLRKAGFQRVAGMMVVGAMMYALAEMVSEFTTEMPSDEREKLRDALPPWLESAEVVYLGADDKSLSYFDPSYMIPHQVFYNAASRALKAGTATESAKNTAKALMSPVASLNIFNQVVSETITNQKRGGGKIFNSELEPEGSAAWAGKVGKHWLDSMFTPGVLRTYNKVRKAQKEEVGFAGSTATMDDVYAGLLGIRPYRMDTTSEKFLNDNLVDYGFRSREAKSSTSDRKQARRTEQEQKEAEEAVTRNQQKLLKEFGATIRMFKTLNISNERIRKATREASVPRYMRRELDTLLAE